MYVFILDDPLVPKTLPASARRLDTQQWVLGLATATTSDQEACGWYVVAEAPPPTISITERLVESIELQNDRPVQVWTVRPETVDEATKRTRLTNATTLRDPAANLAKLTTLREFLTDPDVATFIGRANNTPWDATDRRAAKTAFRTIDRLMKVVESEVRASIGGELLDDISNT